MTLVALWHKIQLLDERFGVKSACLKARPFLAQVNYLGKVFNYFALLFWQRWVCDKVIAKSIESEYLV